MFISQNGRLTSCITEMEFSSYCQHEKEQVTPYLRGVSNDITPHLIVSVHTYWSLENLFRWILEYVRYTASDDFRITFDLTVSDNFTWLFLIDIPEMWNRICKIRLIINTTFIWLTRIQISTTNASSSDNKNSFVILLNLFV